MPKSTDSGYWGSSHSEDSTDGSAVPSKKITGFRPIVQEKAYNIGTIMEGDTVEDDSPIKRSGSAVLSLERTNSSDVFHDFKKLKIDDLLVKPAKDTVYDHTYLSLQSNGLLIINCLTIIKLAKNTLSIVKKPDSFVSRLLSIFVAPYWSNVLLRVIHLGFYYDDIPTGKRGETKYTHKICSECGYAEQFSDNYSFVKHNTHQNKRGIRCKVLQRAGPDGQGNVSISPEERMLLGAIDSSVPEPYEMIQPDLYANYPHSMDKSGVYKLRENTELSYAGKLDKSQDTEKSSMHHITKRIESFKSVPHTEPITEIQAHLLGSAGFFVFGNSVNCAGCLFEAPLVSSPALLHSTMISHATTSPKCKPSTRRDVPPPKQGAFEFLFRNFEVLLKTYIHCPFAPEDCQQWAAAGFLYSPEQNKLVCHREECRVEISDFIKTETPKLIIHLFKNRKCPFITELLTHPLTKLTAEERSLEQYSDRLGASIFCDWTENVSYLSEDDKSTKSTWHSDSVYELVNIKTFEFAQQLGFSDNHIRDVLLRTFFCNKKLLNSRVELIAALQESSYLPDPHDYEAEDSPFAYRGPMCAVCLSNVATKVFTSCGHMSCCSSCAAQNKDCPICRRRVTGIGSASIGGLWKL